MNCPKGYSMGSNGVCMKGYKSGGLTNRPNLSRQGNIGIKPDVRDDCFENCDHLAGQQNQCQAATYPPGISGCTCVPMTQWMNQWDPTTGTWGPPSNTNPVYQCYWSGESYGQCVQGCVGHHAGGPGGRAYVPGVGGSSGTGRWAKGGSISSGDTSVMNFGPSGTFSGTASCLRECAYRLSAGADYDCIELCARQRGTGIGGRKLRGHHHGTARWAKGGKIRRVRRR